MALLCPQCGNGSVAPLAGNFVCCYDCGYSGEDPDAFGPNRQPSFAKEPADDAPKARKSRRGK